MGAKLGCTGIGTSHRGQADVSGKEESPSDSPWELELKHIFAILSGIYFHPTLVRAHL